MLASVTSSVTSFIGDYGLYAVFMTPTFILLAELGARDWHLAGLRIVNTLIGCALGFAAARLLWPSS